MIDHEYMTISLSSDDELLEEDTDDDNEEIVLLESKGKDALVDEEKRKKEEEEEAKEKEKAEKLAQTKAEEEERKRKEEKRKKEEEEKEKERRETELKELEGLTRAANEDSPVSKQQGQILVDLQKDVDKLSHSQAQGFVRSEPDQSKIGTDQEKPLIHVKKEGLFPPAVGTPTAASPAVADADVIVLISSDEDEDMEKEEQDTPSMELQLPSEPTSRSASMEIVDSGSTLEHENEGEKESAVVLSPSESTPDDNLLPKKIDQLVQVKEIPPNKQKETSKTKDKKRHQRKVRRPSTPSQAQVSTPVESNASVLASESSAKATVAPAMPPAVAPDTKDLFMIRRILNTVLKRQKDTNECFDIENLKCRTLMYDAKKEDKKGREVRGLFYY